MKRNNILVALLVSMAGLTSCMDKDWDTPNFNDNPPYGNNTIEKYEPSQVTTIAQLKSKYASIISAGSATEILEDLQIQAVINGNDAGGNIYKQISIQDETGGLIVGINGSDMYPFMPVGQKVLINLKGLYVGGYGEMAQLGTLYNGSIGRMETAMWEQHMRLVPENWVKCKVDTVLFNSKADMNSLCGRIVKLEGVTISGEGTQTLAPEDGTVALTSNCANRTINNNSKVVLRTSTYSDFATRPIPTGKCDLYGVCTRFRDTWQILMRTESDLVELDK